MENERMKLLQEITRHVGQTRAIGMGELYERVFGKPWSHRINDTRELRKFITALRREGVPICSISSEEGGGYYLAGAGSEMEDYCRRLRKQALKKLAQEAALRRVALPELLGQITMNLVGEAGGEKTEISNAGA